MNSKHNEFEMKPQYHYSCHLILIGLAPINPLIENQNHQANYRFWIFDEYQIFLGFDVQINSWKIRYLSNVTITQYWENEMVSK